MQCPCKENDVFRIKPEKKKPVLLISYVSSLYLHPFYARWYQNVIHTSANLQFSLQVCLSIYAILLKPSMKGLKAGSEVWDNFGQLKVL